MSRRWIATMLSLAAVLVVGFSAFSLSGGAKEGAHFSTLATGTAEVLSCADAGWWFLLHQEICTARVTLGGEPTAEAELAPGQLASADIGSAVAVALLRPDQVLGSRSYLYDDGEVLVRNQDRPLRAFNDLVLVGTVVALLTVAVVALRGVPPRREPSPQAVRLGVAPPAVTARAPRWAVTTRVRWLWWTGRLGLLLGLLVQAAGTPTVLVAGTRSDESRWPGLDAALLGVSWGPGAACLALWVVMGVRRTRQRAEAARVLDRGVDGIRVEKGWVVDLEDVRSATGDRPRRRRDLLGGLGLAGLAVVAAVIAVRATDDHAQPWWVDLSGAYPAAVLLCCAVGLLLPSETRTSVVARLVSAAGVRELSDADVARHRRRVVETSRAPSLWRLARTRESPHGGEPGP